MFQRAIGRGMKMIEVGSRAHDVCSSTLQQIGLGCHDTIAFEASADGATLTTIASSISRLIMSLGGIATVDNKAALRDAGKREPRMAPQAVFNIPGVHITTLS